MKVGITENLKNNLVVGLDWLSFTLFDIDLESVIELLGYSRRQFVTFERGAMGYKSMLKLTGESLSILHDGNDNMGIHITCSGSSISNLFMSYKKSLVINTVFGDGISCGDFDETIMLKFFQTILRLGGRFSRIDLAIDDVGSDYFSVSDVSSILDYKNNSSSVGFCSKFRNWQEIVEHSTNGDKTGHTVYMGSRQSDVFLRIYDKKLEQNKKNNTVSDLDWVRWEMEIKGDKAMSLARLLSQQVSVGNTCVGILTNYLRFIDLDKSNKSRCTVDGTWQLFISNIEPLRLVVEKTPRTLDKTKEWIRKQVAPSLAAIVLSEGGCLNFITDKLEEDISRIKPCMLALVQEEVRKWDTNNEFDICF